MSSNDSNKIFAKGFCFYKIFTFFIIGCLIGTYWEEILWFVRFHEIVNRQGLLWGPFSPIYGFGIALFVIILGKHDEKRPLWKTYLYSCILGGVTEYITSLIADKVFGVIFWDYSKMFLNINGRTTIPFMLFWGLGGVLILKVLYPFISKLIERIPYKIGKITFNLFIVFIAIDMIFTYTALGRMTLRNNGVKSYTFIGDFFDKIYSNEYLYNKFPVMSPDN